MFLLFYLKLRIVRFGRQNKINNRTNHSIKNCKKVVKRQKYKNIKNIKGNIHYNLLKIITEEVENLCSNKRFITLFINKR